ncbi:hypothetical protein NE237_021358 [Protea cynaroides]|uniref:Ribosomal RNA-processing protein 8 n=1 Tax=Protea cynaroides TaxID=273540 RepID=A0A9Q0HAZ6_9MAGN|nr:hypothetical protein NE237_021358 [Protea cynaroides]
MERKVVGKRKRKRGRGRGAQKSSSTTTTTTTTTHNNDLKDLSVSNQVRAPQPKRRKTGSLGNSLSAASNSTFLHKMRARLSGGHFRMINEQLYTCSGSEAFNFFKDDPSLFDMYHAGYQEQMSHWPEQPVNIIIQWLKNQSTTLKVVDFGCGDARLAKNVKNKVFSIDLVSNDPSVIACDMSNTPLGSSSMDVAVFCLSLMGTNFPSYLQEAHRVLKPCGWLLIAEVKSRFDPNTGGADPNKFLKAICGLGFNLISKDFSNKMFVLFFFQKKEKQLVWDISCSRPTSGESFVALVLLKSYDHGAHLKDHCCRPPEKKCVVHIMI